MGAKIKGITIEIGGNTTNLQASLKAATDKGKEASAELNKINSALKFNPDNVELLTQKIDVLGNRISATEESFDTLKSAEKSVKEQFEKGDIGAEQYRAFQRDLIATESKLENFKKQLTDTKKEIQNHSSFLGKLKDGYGEVKEKVDTFREAHPKLISAFEKTGDAAKNVAEIGLQGIKGAAEGTAVAMGALVAGGIGVANKLLEISDETKELRDNLGKLETAFTANNSSAENAKSTYVDLYAVLGDSDKATETATHIAAMTSSQEELAKWTEICTGVYGRFGDSLPTEALAEASNETSKTGKLTGALADALNWVGVNEEDFQKKLDACSSEQERQALITETLNGLYGESAEKFKEVSSVLISAQEAQTEYSLSLADLGDAVDRVKNNAIADFLPGITDVVDGLTVLLSGEEGAPELIRNGVESIVDGLATFLPEVTGIIEDVTVTISDLTPDIITSLVNGLLENLDPILEAAFRMLEALSNGLLEKENLEKLTVAALLLVTKLVGFLGDNSDLIIDSAFVMIEALIDGLLADDNMGQLATSTLDIVSALVTGLVDHAPDIITGAFALIGALVDALVEYDWWSVAKDIFTGIKDGLKHLITGESEKSDKEDPPSSHAGGLAYVPYDGYKSELHEGERILTAAENRNYNKERQERESELITLNRKIDAIKSNTQASANRPINIIAQGSARGIARNLTYYIEEEEDRQGVFGKKK